MQSDSIDLSSFVFVEGNDRKLGITFDSTVFTLPITESTLF
jgi:hypothetical protein